MKKKRGLSRLNTFHFYWLYLLAAIIVFIKFTFFK